MNTPFFTWLVARMREPSTWAGISALLVSYVSLSAEQTQAIVTLGIALGGFLAVFMSEKK